MTSLFRHPASSAWFTSWGALQRSCSKNTTPNSESCSENGLFTLSAFWFVWSVFSQASEIQSSWGRCFRITDTDSDCELYIYIYTRTKFSSYTKGSSMTVAYPTTSRTYLKKMRLRHEPYLHTGQYTSDYVVMIFCEHSMANVSKTKVLLMAVSKMNKVLWDPDVIRLWSKIHKVPEDGHLIIFRDSQLKKYLICYQRLWACSFWAFKIINLICMQGNPPAPKSWFIANVENVWKTKVLFVGWRAKWRESCKIEILFACHQQIDRVL